MIIWLVLFEPMKAMSFGTGAPKNVPVVVARSEVCEPLKRLLNVPDTKLECPVLLLDCRGMTFQSMVTTPPITGVVDPSTSYSNTW